MKTYEVRDNQYADYSEEFLAKDDDEALAYGRQWLADGDWPRDETLHLSALVYLDGERIGEAKLTLQPLPPRCISGHDHEWCSPHSVVGGLKENPGVRGSGGGVYTVEVCRHCGKYQHCDTWATDPRNGRQGVERVWYTDADEASLDWIDNLEEEAV